MQDIEVQALELVSGMQVETNVKVLPPDGCEAVLKTAISLINSGQPNLETAIPTAMADVITSTGVSCISETSFLKEQDAIEL